jgi:protoporphyrinogen oxidase
VFESMLKYSKARVLLNTRVTSIKKLIQGKYAVIDSNGVQKEFDNVILAIPSNKVT